ncbi:DUF421 domain-containing protein [Dethiothermospora halolimnae]|uniref:DUF421 domain-containing protein n=1 Tax=Dethiothermospora halolimnae TaxID=3114390 RepID=UPI003CCBC029
MPESKFFDLTIELIIGFFGLFIITKFLRRTQINQITPFDFISALVLGELLGNAIYDNDIGLTYILYAIFIWGCLMFIIEKVTQKIRRSRKILEGDPAIIIRNGQIDYDVIKREKLDINELLSLLREKDVFSIREVEYAILETSGSISVLKKSKYSTPVTQDLKLSQRPVYLPISLILDGEIICNNLEAIGFDEEWLKNQIHMWGLEKVEDVFFAEWKKDEGIHIVAKKES